MDGFWAKTETGIYQIDGSTLNMSLRQKATLSTVVGQLPIAGSNFGRVYSVAADICDFTYAAQNPIVAFWSAGQPVTMISNKPVAAGTWQARFWAYGPATFEVFVFDRTDVIPAGGNFGLKVWAPDGTLIADATLPLMRVIDFRDTRMSIPPGWNVLGFPIPFDEWWGAPGFDKVAVGGVKPGYYASNVTSANSNGQGADGRLMISSWSMQPGGVAFHWIERLYGNPVGRPPNATYFGETLWSSCLLVDVSNL